MIRRLLLITICLLTIGIAEAQLKVTTEADGTVVLTLEASGDINREFKNTGYALANSKKGVTCASKI